MDAQVENENVFNKLNQLISWNILRTLGENPILRSSYFWFIFVPIAAKFLGQIQNPLTINLFGQPHLLNLTLPFNWVLFYFASTAFFIATLLYSIYCPEIIRKYPSSSVFYHLGNGVNTLGHYILEMECEFNKQKKKAELIHVFFNALKLDKEERMIRYPHEQPMSEFWLDLSQELKREEMGDLFNLTSLVHGMTKTFLRFSIAIFYCIGFSLLLIVFFQNFYWVIQVIQ